MPWVPWWGPWAPGWWPTVWPGSWWGLDAQCGGCGTGCGCNTADSLLLPSPAQRVTQVMIDGVELAEGTGWNLFDGRLLVRADGGTWPLCQDWTVPVTGTGAWSVTAVYGEPVPESGRWALIQLAQEYLNYCTGAECKLPAYTTTLSRQGLTQTFPSIKDLKEADSTGLPWVDRFLDAWNPDRLRGHAQVWNPDDFVDDAGQWRAPGGAW